MYDNDSAGKKASSDFDQTVLLSDHVEGAEHMLDAVAETANGDELDYRPNRGHDSRGNYYERQTDYDWTRSTDVGPNRRFGETLAQQEERHGREAEQARHAETARDAHTDDADREASARQLTTSETERADGFEAEADPRADMDTATLADVNQDAVRVSDETGISRAAASRLVADHAADGGSVFDGVFGALLSARAAMNTPVPVADVNPYAYETTIEGTVTHLIEDPDAPNQYQVAYVEDDDGDTAKVTVWVKSVHGGRMVRTLHEGDRVRICGGKPDEYNGLTTVSVTSDTTMCILDRGDGPAPTGDCRASFGCAGDSPRLAPWDAESDTHAWANQMDMDMAVAVTLGD
ncbi:hypothetical protein EGH21_19445 [Halomicroarcula sp. F13]|uniref:Uncharacterized protein n=1 Tax=Haloarcula rubra TaxID=2487747 RepID=A0AAW4PVJ4_9EURY|nr:hypothetical protein [Halomicroarcula rubra]MBX0325204.1 hypothetical protein [Halomicroarcula rubra]